MNQWSGLGGAEVSLLRLLERLPREEVQPVLACPPGALVEEARAMGVETVAVRIPPLKHGYRLGAEDIRCLQRAMTSCDLVHAYSVRAGWYAGRLCRQLGLPMVWSIHDLFTLPWQKLWLRIVAWRYAQAVVAYSRILQKQFGDGLQHKVHLLPHGIDTQVFSPVDALQRGQQRWTFQTAEDALVVLHVGRLMPFKGQHLFLRMAQVLVRRFPPDYALTFWLAGDASMGDPNYAVQMREQARDIDQQVRWLGFQRDIAPIIASADVLVHCSTRPEPFGLVVLEAMACGTAVVSANRGATAEIIEDGRTGLVTPPNDVAALAEGVQTLLTNKLRRQTMAASARQVVCERYTLQQHVQRLIGIYRTLL
ncbi:MAG: glycosyltransferase family 4 protein [bacterium]|nr:glycosyltransferase family 4 protein [bacterium]